MTVRAICYHQNVPTVYNAGTKYESYANDFQACLFCGTLAEAQAYADTLNNTKPEKLFTGEPALCDERVYYAEEGEL